MRRPANDAWFESQMCGPLVVYFKVVYFNGHVVVVVCPDDDDKAEERAFYGSEGKIRGREINSTH